ncbi:hypothetical protein F511_21145 [Dorcoceras hygrometricum]|uniref:Uncharacterized protein n=1 Tax=Dorcoceras hygrometricum TaxID=472368 RepID=A0A2Z7AFV5_9LAMI|nr:hypothetical protein F511_21145 [Dorcoceras hygrometricum]
MGIDQLGFQSVQLGLSAITARWYSDSTDQLVTTPMIELYLSGTTHLSAGHNVALSQMFTAAQPVPRCLILPQQISPRHGKSQPTQFSFLLVQKSQQEKSLELKSVKSFQNSAQILASTTYCLLPELICSKECKPVCVCLEQIWTTGEINGVVDSALILRSQAPSICKRFSVLAS